ncbi:hypothetical protein [Natronorubrum sulfidifaciens]|uniref:hypothetical protein n=1 Tax=Natronorubrum sulfidifaciens TaxID=388259 RepID=UPI00067802F5|nr:hypothetical protein [Natronorubrum sulfidifaciens]
MIDTLIAGVGVSVVLLIGVGLARVVRRRWQPRGRHTLANDLDERLAERLETGTATHLEQSPTVRRIAVVDSETETPLVVPIVRVDLETTDAPGMTLLFEYVAAVLEAIHPILDEREERVDHYDVEFTFGPGGLFVEGECRRVSVAPELAARLLERERYGAFELCRDVKRADKDDDSPTVLWGNCRRGRSR